MTASAAGRAQTDLRATIQSVYRTLPENQRKVADFVLQHARDVAFLSIQEFEEQSGVSKATIVRLAQSLGFSGYDALRARLRKSVQNQMQQKEKFPLLATDRKGALTIVAHQDVRNINQTINALDRDAFNSVAAMILKASHVYTLGLGISSLMSQILAYSLNQVAVRAKPFVHDYETFAEQLAFVTTTDLLIAFSFPPYSRETVEAVRKAHERRIPVVAITDKLTSPVTFYSKKVIPIRSQNLLFTNSFSAISVVINALATEVAVRSKPRAVKLAKEIDQQLEEMGHYVSG
jgi:DNA-binding MurR/RpiR family transcriptional regulator